MFSIHVCYFSVPTPPEGFIIRITDQNIPEATLFWSQPRLTFGTVQQYRIRYGLQEQSSVQERRLPPSNLQFTTPYLGKLKAKPVFLF